MPVALKPISGRRRYRLPGPPVSLIYHRPRVSFGRRGALQVVQLDTAGPEAVTSVRRPLALESRAPSRRPTGSRRVSWVAGQARVDRVPRIN